MLNTTKQASESCVVGHAARLWPMHCKIAEKESRFKLSHFSAGKWSADPGESKKMIEGVFLAFFDLAKAKKSQVHRALKVAKLPEGPPSDIFEESAPHWALEMPSLHRREEESGINGVSRCHRMKKGGKHPVHGDQQT